MKSYSPFTKPFDEVSTMDLPELEAIAEGWYVEYKRELSNASAIAKSITAMANTHGGWVFYGIGEKSKDDAVAGSFLGLERAKADAALQTIRQAVANHAQPSPHFDTKAFFGPNEQLGLADDRCIIAVRVPWGPEAPYVHKDGRIYRRVADGSEPKPENDRFILDQLWKRSEPILRSYRDWVDEELEISQGEEEGAFLQLLLALQLRI